MSSTRGWPCTGARHAGAPWRSWYGGLRGACTRGLLPALWREVPVLGSGRFRAVGPNGTGAVTCGGHGCRPCGGSWSQLGVGVGLTWVKMGSLPCGAGLRGGLPGGCSGGDLRAGAKLLAEACSPRTAAVGPGTDLLAPRSHQRLLPISQTGELSLPGWHAGLPRGLSADISPGSPVWSAELRP